MIHYFPLQNLENRDYRMFDQEMQKAFREFNLPFYIYSNELTEAQEIKSGWVMDAVSHPVHCIEQAKDFLQRLDTVKSGDVLFFNDLTHFGLDAMKYALDLCEIRGVKIFGYVHAGTFTDFDYAQKMKKWLRHSERAWFEIATRIFVATQKPYLDLQASGLIDMAKVRIVGHPFDISVFSKVERKPRQDWVIFPHRVDIDKQPFEFLSLAKLRPGMKFIFTFGGKGFESNIELYEKASEIENVICYEHLSKKQYYELLAQCKIMVSTAIQENWGVATYEALHLGVIPICPRSCSYQYILPDFLLYNTFEEMVQLVSNFSGGDAVLDSYWDDGKSAEVMVKSMLECIE